MVMVILILLQGGSNPRNNINVNGKINQQEPGSTPNLLKNTTITGSLIVTAGITGSFSGSGTFTTLTSPTSNLSGSFSGSFRWGWKLI